MANSNDYPGLSTRPAMISGLLLILWGAFTIGIQTYVYMEFATKYEVDKNGVDEVWRDAYNGLCLANGILCMIAGLFCFVTIPNRSASTLTTSLILAVLGSLLAAGSVVLSALQSRILDKTNNGGLDNHHPCINPINSTDPENPGESECLDWFALQLTVTALSGLAFLDFFVIVLVVARGLSSGRGGRQETSIPAQSHYQGANGVKPYQAYNNHAMVPDIWDSQPTSMNPRYNQHLQQLGNMNQQQPGKPVNDYQNQYENNQQQSMTIQRGQLQVLHNQRHKMAPPPAPVAPHTSYSRF